MSWTWWQWTLLGLAIVASGLAAIVVLTLIDVVLTVLRGPLGR